jgi:D-arabinose 1-dehydrogenase-like Zn-dependent alcohol dehydrogenase
MGVKIAHALGADVTVLNHSLKNKITARGWEQIISMLHQIRRLSKSSKDIDLIINTLSIEIDCDQ